MIGSAKSTGWLGNPPAALKARPPPRHLVFLLKRWCFVPVNTNEFMGMLASTHFNCERLDPVPSDFLENEVRVNSVDYRQIAGRTAGADFRHPRGGRIVRVTNGKRSFYRLLKESHLLPLGTCWIGEKTEIQNAIVYPYVRLSSVSPQWFWRLFLRK